jgi:ABC-type uncharacterized transport system ATPase subunit
MSTASTTTSKKRKTDPVTFEQLAEKKLRDNLERYRGYVQRAVAGEFLNEHDLEEVAGLLSQLRLPELAWSQHQEAIRDNLAAAERQRQIEADSAAKEGRLRELVAEMNELEKLLEQKRRDIREGQRGQTRLVDALRKQNELRVLYPDVIDTLDNAVSRRLDARETLIARHRDKPTGTVHDGWST